MARRWRWPPDSLTPFSPTSVCNPCGIWRDNSIACAASAAAMIVRLLRITHRAVGDIGSYRIVKQDDVLAYQRDIARKLASVSVSRIAPIEQDAARLGR